MFSLLSILLAGFYFNGKLILNSMLLYSKNFFGRLLLLVLLLLIGCKEQTAQVETAPEEPIASTTSGYSETNILLQGFYWDCFNEAGAGNWWDFVESKLPELSEAGITEIWLPPAQKSNHSPSMGYDPYDYFDLGEFNQKGRTETYFGSRTELENLIETAHQHNVNVYADLVYNHNSGGEREWNPNTEAYAFTEFDPMSGRYDFNYNNFHPSTFAAADAGNFGGFADLAHANPNTYRVLEENIKWLKNEIGFDGWRFDYVKGFSPETVKKLHAVAGGFTVGEYYDGDKSLLQNWLNVAGPSVHIFDFPQFFAIKAMANNQQGTFDMKILWDSGMHFQKPYQTVTFVENHDTDKDDPVVTDKMMAYAFIMTHEGMPTVFWKDYFNYKLARVDQPNGIHRLMWVRRNLARGNTELLFEDKDLYIAQRTGDPGLLIAMNDHPDEQENVIISTKWKNKKLIPYAFISNKNDFIPADIETNEQGKISLTVPPRGYVVYAPG